MHVVVECNLLALNNQLVFWNWCFGIGGFALAGSHWVVGELDGGRGQVV